MPNYPTTGVLLFEGDQTGEHVAIYPGNLSNNPKAIATITDGISLPYGLAMDKTGKL
ncbi:MAG: hypothetical protein ABI231_04580 [Candidatus Tumulicola sp.]